MKVGGSWRINLWITCKKPDPNRTFFMDFGAFFWWNLRHFTWSYRGCWNHPHAYFLIDVQKSNFSSNFEKVPKSMKNVRFWSGFLHVILKLIHQKDYNKKITITTFVREKTSKSPYSRACCHGPVRGRAPCEDLILRQNDFFGFLDSSVKNV